MPQDPEKKLWIGNIPEQAKWKDLQALVDEVGNGSLLQVLEFQGSGVGGFVGFKSLAYFFG